jgi:hypothetical protein
MTFEQSNHSTSELFSMFEAAERLSKAVTRNSPYRMALDLLKERVP